MTTSEERLAAMGCEGDRARRIEGILRAWLRWSEEPPGNWRPEDWGRVFMLQQHTIAALGDVQPASEPPAATDTHGAEAFAPAKKAVAVASETAAPPEETDRAEGMARELDAIVDRHGSRAVLDAWASRSPCDAREIGEEACTCRRCLMGQVERLRVVANEAEDRAQSLLAEKYEESLANTLESLAAKHEATARDQEPGAAIRGGAFDGVPRFDFFTLMARAIREALTDARALLASRPGAGKERDRNDA